MIQQFHFWAYSQKNWKQVLKQVFVQQRSPQYFFFPKFIYYSFWLCWVFVAARGLSLVVASRGYSSLRCAGFSLWWLLLLRSTGSRCTGFSSCGSRALERRLSSCGAWAQLLHGMWDLPGPGLEPVSPALAGRFLTTVPPGKPPSCTFYSFFIFPLKFVMEYIIYSYTWITCEPLIWIFFLVGKSRLIFK